jgi:hypothetical protein
MPLLKRGSGTGPRREWDSDQGRQANLVGPQNRYRTPDAHEYAEARTERTEEEKQQSAIIKTKRSRTPNLCFD